MGAPAFIASAPILFGLAAALRVRSGFSSSASRATAPTDRLPPQHRRQHVFAHLQRFAPHVPPIELEQVEGIQKHPSVLASGAQLVEHRQPIAVTSHRLAVDQKDRARSVSAAAAISGKRRVQS
jgi:hypothetical protein